MLYNMYGYTKVTSASAITVNEVLADGVHKSANTS